MVVFSVVLWTCCGSAELTGQWSCLGAFSQVGPVRVGWAGRASLLLCSGAGVRCCLAEPHLHLGRGGPRAGPGSSGPSGRHWARCSGTTGPWLSIGVALARRAGLQVEVCLDSVRALTGVLCGFLPWASLLLSLEGCPPGVWRSFICSWTFPGRVGLMGPSSLLPLPWVVVHTP